MSNTSAPMLIGDNIKYKSNIRYTIHIYLQYCKKLPITFLLKCHIYELQRKQSDPQSLLTNWHCGKVDEEEIESCTLSC